MQREVVGVKRGAGGYTQRMLVWSAALVVAIGVLGGQALVPGWQWLPAPAGSSAAGVLLLLFLAALACEYVDSSLGMGYGTTLTPLLLLAGYEPAQIVPAVLLSEFLTGLFAALMHHRDGNVDLLRDPDVRRGVLLLSCLSAAGAIAAVTVAVHVSKFWLTLFITAIILSMGVVVLATARRRIRYRARNLVLVGTLAAFNKGLSGGGYGPLVTAGQVVSGVPAKHAVAITSLAEALTCLVGLAAYLLLQGAPDWGLALPLAAGALLSVPTATATVRWLPESTVRTAVGALTLVLGMVALGKLLL